MMIPFSYSILFLLGLFSFFVISSKNPVHSVLSLVSVFLLSSILLLSIEAEFLALSFIIVYVGAIAVLFLFVVMMLDIKIGDRSLDILSYGPFAYFLIFIFILEIAIPLSSVTFISNNVLPSAMNWTNYYSVLYYLPNIQCIGQLLYTHYFIYFLMSGFILFIAILGSIMLTFSLNKLHNKSLPLEKKFFFLTSF